jgi:hypothetical protein
VAAGWAGTVISVLSSGVPIGVPPFFTLSKSHTGDFTQGQTGATFTISVESTSTTTGTVTVTDQLPFWLTLVSMSGVGWTCTGNTCSRGDPLSPGLSYQPIIVTVNVLVNAISPLTNVAIATSGISTRMASDTVNIDSGAPPVALLNSPPNGATGVSIPPTLTWSASNGANYYNVFFGTSPTPPFVRGVTTTSYSPGALTPGRTYYWAIAASNDSGGTLSMVRSFVTSTTTKVATVAFRDTAGGIRLSSYPSSALFNSDGLFASDPSAAQDSSGNTFVTARDTFNAVWANVYSASNQTWGGWQFGGGVIQGVPSVAVAGAGTGWIGSRDNYNSYWLLSYGTSTGFGSWTHLAGVFATDPVITSCSDGSLYVVGKDNYNALWSGHYIPGTGFQGFVLGGGVVQGKPAVSCGSDNAAYIVARDNYNSNWIARVAGNTWTGWFNGGAVTNIDPRIAALGGSLAVVILDGTGAVYRSTFLEGSGNGWQGWTNVGGVLSDVAAAAVGGELFFAGRAPNGDLWWWQQNGNQWTGIGNNGVAAGALSASPK